MPVAVLVVEREQPELRDWFREKTHRAPTGSSRLPYEPKVK